ncbi:MULTISPECIES: zinc-dependent alcohol dehydrogenase family protein [unclassified Nesterenkonia]|uniref:zinc-dependent alcohol dehydrogenase family protein n=1 Tax=unclassified Nesterenkonia TaxID=2629769 RepID=UPI001F4C6675|nr:MULTISPECIES: zinc-dependent alcohol dehydrogenase family protein [unclassified Nesterenkonia]MCH8560382.1 zinc-dependent alcohol dehydrogenase family protein [Nesterenkonia sp. DZ6]MCH8562647.1 zinc-dependent alcohol dehydrogenase family protein [Nesterenkonia sp. YGD6]MCH8570490.1 zinc-dependent alcohol dehydrogenase family protein [Nesterenkonia sp. AY15]
MKTWRSSSISSTLECAQMPVPTPEPDEVLLRVEACGVCRTDLHVIDHELPPRRADVVPGHQIIGIVEARGSAVRRIELGDRVGAAWLRRTCGICAWCRAGRENLCPDSLYTGWDADGGFAEYATVPASFAYPLDPRVDPVQTAPLLCAGIIGYRALTRSMLPPGGRLGIYGFGSSGHLTAQLAMAAGAQVCVMTRGETNRRLARRLGVDFVSDAFGEPPEPLDAAIIFAPAGDLVPAALKATTRGGTVTIAGIHMSDLPRMPYQEHLFYERDLRSVTANTRADGIEFLRLAQRLGIQAEVTPYPFDELPVALEDLRRSRVSGSLVLTF